MALIIEDGTGVAGANSYITPAEVKAYAAARGLTVPADDSEVEKLCIKAIDYLETLRSDYQGRKIALENSLQWPRSGVVLDGFDLAETVIPNTLKDAQAQLAIEAQTRDLMPTGDGREVKIEKVVGAIEMEYVPTGAGSIQPEFQKVNMLLRPLMKQGLAGLSLKSVRV